MKYLFTQEKTGSLRVEREDLEEYLQRVHTDNQGHVDLVLPADIPPVTEIGSPMARPGGERLHLLQALMGSLILSVKEHLMF